MSVNVKIGVGDDSDIGGIVQELVGQLPESKIQRNLKEFGGSLEQDEGQGLIIKVKEFGDTALAIMTLLEFIGVGQVKNAIPNRNFIVGHNPKEVIEVGDLRLIQDSPNIEFQRY